ncbi:CTP synthase C-terminal region-related (seleno)protein [Gracilibacillus kekensis]|uniref:CTP synthase C-terminal region-related (seleno)protein n=1 Tax=Gracilibacillus kekensis TaxID=1027249 RepID=UPI00147AD1F4|nr:CTP synthase [Gracilibacillus kekensis]
MKFGIIGDFNPDFIPHVTTNEAIVHSCQLLNAELQGEWVPTEIAESDFQDITKQYKGFWISPGSPYKSMKGALKIIEFARKNNVPLFGTCGGFQHIVIEFARNVLNITDAEHAEYDPYGSKLVINHLVCSLAGKSLEINLTDKLSKTHQIYNSNKIVEQYYCNFGLNHEYKGALDESGLLTVGEDENGETRILELKNHKYFIGTLFVPQIKSTVENPHPLITEFIKQILSS